MPKTLAVKNPRTGHVCCDRLLLANPHSLYSLVIIFGEAVMRLFACVTPRATLASLPRVTPRVTPGVTPRVTPTSLHRVTHRVTACVTPLSYMIL